MSSGFVTTNIPRRPDKVKGPLGVEVKLPAIGSNPGASFSMNDLLFHNPVASYRSGPMFDKAVRSPGAILGNTYASEVLQAARGDIGHEFLMERVTHLSGKTRSRRINPNIPVRYSQMTYAAPTFTVGSSVGTSVYGVDLIDYTSSNYAMKDSDLVTLGTSFIKSTNPIQSQVNLLSSIAEAVTDGTLLPGLLGKQIVSSAITPGKRRDLIRATGSEYLNYIFGYKPLADDIAKVGVLIDTVNTFIDQWIKDNGTIVRRRRRVPKDPRTIVDKSYSYNQNQGIPTHKVFAPSKTKTNWGYVYEFGMGAQVPPEFRGSVEHSGLMVARVSEEITFSAGYEYDFTKLYLPTGQGSAADLMHNAALRRDLGAIVFGLDPGSVFTAAYDATPFSWLLDWFVNIGDVIDNFRGLQTRGVQLLWGYITQTVIRDAYFENRMRWTPTGEVFFHSDGIARQKRIRRIRATPFGFGVSYAGLTSSQNATLAALAASKLPEVRLEHR